MTERLLIGVGDQKFFTARNKNEITDDNEKNMHSIPRFCFPQNDFTPVVLNRDYPAAWELKLAEKVKVETLFEILCSNL